MHILALTLTVLVSAQAGPALPSSALAPLRAALSTDEARLDGRLVLGNAMTDHGKVTVSYTAPEGGATVIKVVLGHASQGPDGVKAGPFVILSRQGDDEAAVAALVGRLDKLDAGIWQARKAEAEAPRDEASDEPVISEADRRAARLLWAVDLAIMVGDTEDAVRQLDALGRASDFSSSVLLDLVERYRRVKATEQATATLERWRTRTINDITSPIEAGRAEVLGGGDISPLKVLQNARVSGELCGFEHLASAMDAMGHRTDGYQLLDTAARKTDCPDVEATMLEWFVADGRSQEAAELSAILMGHDAHNRRVAAVRATLLLAADHHQAVVDLLETLVTHAPMSNLLGPYIEARLHLITGEGDLTAVGEVSDAETGDPLQALVAAFAHHREGQEAAARRYLERAGATYGAHPVVALLRARIAFDRGDRATVGRVLDESAARDLPDLAGAIAAFALRGELLRWTDHAAAKATLRKAMLLAARQVQGVGTSVERLKGQIVALDECLEDGSKPPCEGPFLHPRDHDGNTALGDADSSPFGNGLIIFGVLLIFVVIVRQGRINKRRSSRWK